MIQEFGPIEIDIDGRTQKVRPVGSWVLELITYFVNLLTN